MDYMHNEIQRWLEERSGHRDEKEKATLIRTRTLAWLTMQSWWESSNMQPFHWTALVFPLIKEPICGKGVTVCVEAHENFSVHSWNCSQRFISRLFLADFCTNIHNCFVMPLFYFLHMLLIWYEFQSEIKCNFLMQLRQVIFIRNVSGTSREHPA